MRHTSGVRLSIRAGALLLVLLIAVPVPRVLAAECDARRAGDVARTLGVLRRIDEGLTYLAWAQTEAIVETSSGVKFGVNTSDAGFFGPSSNLRKRTDKTETELNGLDKDLRRAPLFSELEPRYEEVRSLAAAIVEAGYEMGAYLDDPQGQKAARLYAEQTYPAVNKARAVTYTLMSGLERDLAKTLLLCR